MFVCALASAFVFNHYSPNGIALTGQWETSKGSIKAISKSDNVSATMEIIDIKTIKDIVENKKRIIIDVRNNEIFKLGHIPNAVSFPLEEFDDKFIEMMEIIKKDSPVLVYCESAECPDSHAFADHLIMMQFSDVKIFSGGYAAWKEKGYPVEEK